MPAGLELLSDSDIEVGIWVGGGGLVHDVSLLALASEWALLPLGCLTVAFFSIIIFLALTEDFSVVRLYDFLDVGGATVRQLQGVFVKNGVQLVVRREMLSYKLKKHSSYFCLESLVEGGRKVHDFSLLSSAAIGVSWASAGRFGHFELVLISTLC